MPIVDTSELAADTYHPDNDQIYNGLDCCLTLEIFEELSSLPSPPIYDFVRALQAPALAMMQRGFLVDQYARAEALEYLRAERERCNDALQQMAYACWDRGINPRSTKQLQSLFYDTMHLPKILINDKGTVRLSMNSEVLEKLEMYLHARPIAATILAIRALDKQIEDFEQVLDADGRYRTSFNVAGTTTWRFSSSKSSLGTGGNLQNKKRDDDLSTEELSLRKPFIADPGCKLCEIDLEQAESHEVGWMCWILFGDSTYLDACESGDLHTTVSRFAWPDLLWSGHLKSDRKLAESTIIHRGDSCRQTAKPLGHGCLTADHEVLTRNGWVAINTKPSEIMTWNNGKSSFARCSNWIDKIYSGILVEIEGNSISLCATADHRVLFSKDGINGRLHEVPASDISEVGQIPLGRNYIGGTNCLISPQIARLIAAYQCGGHKNSNRTISFHFHKDRKFKRLADLVLDAGPAYSIRIGANNKAYVSYEDGSIEWWPKQAREYLLDWPMGALAAYIDELKFWDGHISSTAQCLFSANREHLEWIQTIGRLIGVGGNFQKTHVSGFGTIMHTLQQNNRLFASIRSLNKSYLTAIAQVYCPTVPGGAFYIRRKGRISITGNSNYYGQPPTLSKHTHIPIYMVKEFQRRYFSAFPGIQRWHRWVAQQLQTKNEIVNSFGVARTFFGRPNDDSTLREAIAHGPQSATAMRTNLALWRIWHYLPQVDVLAQKHDSITFQAADDSNFAGVVGRALELMSTKLTHNGRSFDVPGEAKVGWNWGKYDEKLNPDGMVKWRGSDNRTRHTGKDRLL